ncbi:MAG: hypothetical protein ABI234_18905 [Ktedonobacteraceae bacterium]
MRQRWKASWKHAGVPCEFVFDSLSNRMIAGIDFKLKLNSLNEPIPEIFELEEMELLGKEHINGGWTYTKAVLGYPVSQGVPDHFVRDDSAY